MDRISYSSSTTGLVNRANELLHLVRMARRPAQSSVAWVKWLFEGTKQRLLEATGVDIRGMKGLDIGPGQQLGCLRCFSLENEMVAIDTDVIAQGFDPGDYVRMVQQNSALRALKTLARKSLGVDARFAAALAEELGVERFPPSKVLQMSATQMTFRDETFDFVYSHSVFEHIDHPEAALAEVDRVLRPGGVAYISIHLYTSHSGAHDPRIFAEGVPVAPLWPHLRPAHAASIHSNSYLNRVSMDEWRAIFQRKMPGTTFINDRQDDEIGDGLRLLRHAGELASYTDEELMTVNFVGIWRKPGSEDSIAVAGAKHEA